METIPARYGGTNIYLGGVGRGARREGDEKAGYRGRGDWAMRGVVACREFKVHRAAADAVTQLRVSGTQIAIVRQRLILRLICNRMRNAVRESARLREQQRENQQESGKQRVRHGAHFNQLSSIRQGVYSLSSLSDGVNDQVRVMVRMSTSRVMSGGSGA